MDYYKKKLLVAQVNLDDAIEGKIERWQAHKQGILHRGYTVILTYQNKYIFQQRKHPVFNRCYDLSYSSHQVFVNTKLQEDLEAIYEGLFREWNLKIDDLVKQPVKNGGFYYKAQDLQSKYIEHEIDHVYRAELKKLPKPNFDYCYGFILLEKLTSNMPKPLAPWIDILIKNNLFK
jgi:isopentenyldiphosphate isomerase